MGRDMTARFVCSLLSCLHCLLLEGEAIRLLFLRMCLDGKSLGRRVDTSSTLHVLKRYQSLPCVWSCCAWELTVAVDED